MTTASPGSDPFCLKLVTGKVPFAEYTDQNVIVMIAKGKRPSRPHSFDAPGITPEVWKVAQKCWNGKVGERPEISTVLEMLEPLEKSGVCTDELSRAEEFDLQNHRSQRHTAITFPTVGKIVLSG